MTTHQQSTSPPTNPPPFPFQTHLLVLVAIKVLGPLADRRLNGRNLCLGGTEPPRRGRSGGGGGHHTGEWSSRGLACGALWFLAGHLAAGVLPVCGGGRGV